MNKYALVLFNAEYNDEGYEVGDVETVLVLDESLAEVPTLNWERQEIIDLAYKYTIEYKCLPEPPDPILLDLESGKLLSEVLLERANIKS